jgi:hypothetical protein
MGDMKPTKMAKGGKAKGKPVGKPDKAAKTSGKLDKRARFVEMLKRFKK